MQGKIIRNYSVTTISLAKASVAILNDRFEKKLFLEFATMHDSFQSTRKMIRSKQNNILVEVTSVIFKISFFSHLS
jgi:hypothetical protein